MGLVLAIPITAALRVICDPHRIVETHRALAALETSAATGNVYSSTVSRAAPGIYTSF